jgi:SpoIID/LytB domain protein
MTTQTQNPAYRPSAILFRALLAAACAAAVIAPAAAQKPSARSPGLATSPAGPAVSVRVGLVRAFPRCGALTITAPSGCVLRDADGTAAATGPGVWRFTAADGKVAWYNGDADEPTRAAAWRAEAGPTGPLPQAAAGARGKPRRYRGALDIACDPAAGTSGQGRLRVVNQVALDEYLRGVVPMEMPASAPAAALRAQAIVARTFAIRSLGKFKDQGYDLRDSTESQVYDGADAETVATDAAIRDTEGLVVTRGGALIWSDYYDDCGGVTSPGDRPDDYPPSVVDAPESGGPDYCARGTYHTWMLTLSGEQILAQLGPARRQRVGKLQDLVVTEQDASGRVRRLRLVGESGDVELTGAALRAALGYDRLRSTLFMVSRGDTGDYVFDGRGHGHGHGLCQWGAMGLASPPYNRSFRDILEHYFPGAAVMPVRNASLPATPAQPAR